MAQAASKTCEICVSAPGSQYCLDCEQYYCENCKSLHKRQKLSTNHQFQHASELIPEGKSRCSQHKEEFNLMCNTCNVPVCTSCVTGNHNGHTFSKLVDVIAQLRGENENQIRDKTNEANQNITKIEDSLKSFDNDVQSVIKAITDQSNNIKCMVDKSVSQMIALVKEQSTKEKDKLMNILSAAKSTLVAGQNLDRRRLDLDNARPDETMVQQINKMKEEISKLDIDSLPEFPKISFDSKAVTVDDIRQLIGSYTLSGCSPVKEKEYPQHGWLYRCSDCGKENILPDRYSDLLICFFHGSPLPDIEWYLPGINQPIQPSSKYQFTDPSVRRNLRITHLDLTDEGTYMCKGVNIGGYVEARIYVNVTSKPIFQEGETLKSQVIPDGQNAVFRCKMESLPDENTPSEPIWRINRKELSDEQYDSNFSHKYQLSADKEILTIKNVKYPEDSSSISCETGNIIFDRNGEDSYAKSYAYAFLRVMACPYGFILTNGSDCEPCTENWYGNDCLCFCECNNRQRCDNVLGCVDTSSRVTTTQSTIPRFVDRNLVVYILVIVCGMILVLGLCGCKNIWKTRDSRQIQSIKEDNRNMRVTLYNGIYDEVEALELVGSSNINPIQMKNITNAKEEAGSSDDTYPKYNDRTTVATSFALHESCRCIHTSDQSNFAFENNDDTHNSNVYEQIYDLTNEPCGYTNDSPQFIKKDNAKVEYLKPYQPLQGNCNQAPQTDADTFPLQTWTMKSKSSSEKIEENNEKEHYINGNMKFSYEDEQLL
ncbi:Hypothetical predicted protein [Mytilus galloprovincialis]|uniref:Uncharacterized protein n=1 Tax=Mytilus galloprovincialis TaxID=29158 RepID=A0A8B6E7G9_MYTGA|nr:Hypothetical predicted protein [Mytilus galloprovincialis]